MNITKEMKRPSDEIVIFLFVGLIFYYITALFVGRLKGLILDNDANLQVLYLLVGIVSGWLGKGKTEK